MKSKEQIIKDSLKLDSPPDDYSLIEIHCFLALHQLTIMFYNGQVSKESAGLIKQKILSEYENLSKQYDFWTSIYKEHIEHIKDTEESRTRLHKILNGNNPITEESLCETINVCMDIISTIFKGEFINEK